MSSRLEPIGSQLVRAGLITVEQLERALDRQRRAGGYIGEHLIEDGAITAADFHEALARSWGVQRRDLVADPPAAALLLELDVQEVVDLGWLACEVTDDGSLVVASCVRPSEDLVVEVLERFGGMPVEFVACSRGDIDQVALSVRRMRLDLVRRPTARTALVRPAHQVLGLGGAVAALLAATRLPVGVLSVVLVLASAVFLIGALAQMATGYATLLGDPGSRPRRHHPEAKESMRADEPVAADADLPLYSAIVRFSGGHDAVARLFDNFGHIDYPRARIDGILVVCEDDAVTLAALRGTGRRGWVRVAKVSAADFADGVRAYDHGLALARGRYVVAYDQDEHPDSDQLRRAVAAFEADLAARLDGRLPADPLVGLRVARRRGPHGPTPFERLSAIDDILHEGSHGAEVPDLAASVDDITSVHFNMRLLRRHGGFELLLRDGGPVTARKHAPRIESLASSSTRASAPTARRWMARRADRLAQVLLDGARLAGDLVRRPGGRKWPEVRPVVARTGAAVMFLCYPVALGGGIVAGVRWGSGDGSTAVQAIWIALVMAGIVLGAVVAVVASLLVRRRGWLAGFGALVLPVHWLLHGQAAWTAVWALAAGPLTRRRR